MPDSYQILEALLERDEAGELPAKKANMLVHLQGKVKSGLPITEMQAELLEESGEPSGVC